MARVTYKTQFSAGRILLHRRCLKSGQLKTSIFYVQNVWWSKSGQSITASGYSNTPPFEVKHSWARGTSTHCVWTLVDDSHPLCSWIESYHIHYHCMQRTLVENLNTFPKDRATDPNFTRHCLGPSAPYPR